MGQIWKIRRKSDGLYSLGGTEPTFNKKGKVWKQRSHVASHITQVVDHGRHWVYADCELVCYQMTETGSEAVRSLMVDRLQAKSERERRFYEAFTRSAGWK